MLRDLDDRLVGEIGIALRRLRCASVPGGRGGAVHLDLPEHGARGHGLVRPDEDLGEDSAGRGGDLRIDLVGGDLDDSLVGLDGVAFRLEPLQDRPLGHRFAHLGHGDLDGCPCVHLEQLQL